MSTQLFNPRTLLIIFFIFIVAAFRVIINMNGPLFPLANFSPIGAIALFSGAHFNSRSKSYLIPLLILFASDFALSMILSRHYESGFLYSGWYWVYAAFALMVLVGRCMLKKVSAKQVVIAAFTVTAIHWIVCDLGVWLQGTLYPKNVAGLWTCLAAAIPFERNFLAGTILYSVVLFGAYEWLQRKYPFFSLA